jgi:hypothetical protein
MSPPLISKAAARYTGAGGREHCSLCRHFSPRRGGRCARVLGDISPMGWCRLFSREMRGLIPDASSFNGGGGGPAMALDFLTPGTLDPRITFTRASTATYFNSAGVMQSAAINTPRWDYDPATLQLRGLLLEDQRTNLLLNSATLGTQSVTVTAQVYTLSFYGTGTITKSGTATGALVGTGVGQRVTQTFTPTAGSLTCTVTGTVSNAQIEAGDFATSYIPTTGATATRNIDSCLITPANMAPWFVPPGGSWFAEFRYFDATPAAPMRVVGQPNAANLSAPVSISVGTATGQYDGITLFSANAAAANSLVRSATTWMTGQAKACTNGGAVATSAALVTGYNVLATSGIGFMSLGPVASTNNNNGHIRAVRYWPSILTNAQMQAITAP